MDMQHDHAAPGEGQYAPIGISQIASAGPPKNANAAATAPLALAIRNDDQDWRGDCVADEKQIQRFEADGEAVACGCEAHAPPEGGQKAVGQTGNHAGAPLRLFGRQLEAAFRNYFAV